MQIENYNKPFLDAMSQYDDGLDLSNYDFNQDGFGPPSDDVNKRKLAYRHRTIANKYKQVLLIDNHQALDHYSILYLLHASNDDHTNLSENLKMKLPAF